MNADQPEHVDRAKRPLALTVLALVLIVIGGIGLVNLVVLLFNGPGAFDFNALAILPGMGLLRLSSAWRRFTLVVACFNLAMLMLAGVLYVRDPSGTIVRISIGSHGEVEHPSPHLVWGCLAVDAVLLIWTVRVLMRADIRQLFREADRQEEARPVTTR